MSSSVFKIRQRLEGHYVHITLGRTRPNTIRVNATLVGERVEIDVFEDDHAEVSRFRGNEDVEGKLPLLEAILAEHAFLNEPVGR